MAPRNNHLGQPIGSELAGWQSRPHPQPVTMKGEWCRLEPLSLDHSGSLFHALHGEAAEARWTYFSVGPFDDEQGFAKFVAEACSRTSHQCYVILKDDQPAGIASFARINPGNGSIEVGGIMYGPTLSKTTAATEAMYLMARYVFEDLGYRRYEWKCDSLNAASRHSALRLGFEYEGTWRNALVYKGRNRDTAWFSMTDRDWAGYVKPAFEAWLSPSNFREGKQLTSLSSHMQR